MKKGNIVLIIICIIILTVGLILMPNVYKFMNNKSVDSNLVVEKKNEKVNEKTEINLDSEILKELVYPIMHNDISTTESYYKLDKLSVNDLSNNDILFNAFLQVYSGYLVSGSNIGCAKPSVSLSANYIELRIKNIFGSNTNYTLTDFTVPNGANSNYTGTFKYNSTNNQYIYYGNCNAVNSKTNYYDVTSIYDVSMSDDENQINVYYYVGFLKVDNNNYTLYSDSNYLEEVSSGNFNSLDEISKLLSKLKVKKYQFTFRKDTCNYDSYCFYEGKWIK